MLDAPAQGLPCAPSTGMHRRTLLRGATALLPGSLTAAPRATAALAQEDPLPAWNDSAAKTAILDFVMAATDEGDADFIPVADRIATCDQDFYLHEFWRFVHVQQEVATFARTFIDFPPQQTPASFNVDAIVTNVKEQIAKHPYN